MTRMRVKKKVHKKKISPVSLSFSEVHRLKVLHLKWIKEAKPVRDARKTKTDTRLGPK